ncbi:MAG: hypothetical protein H7A52_17130 [Akkermansiaceae bacterium]|nr:hypothetical protein [Akkermansiaceae bacterium]
MSWRSLDETLSVEFGPEIKEKSPAPRTSFIELDGHDAWLGTSRFEKHSSEVLAKDLLETLRELWGEEA